jgi:tetratricopeptide (TPR) repeat protein
VNRDNILYGVIGLLAGLIIGYLGTNSINRSETIATSAAPAAGREQPSLPPDHPPSGSAANSSGGMQAEVTATLETAKNEPGNFDAQMKAASLFYQIKRYDQALNYFERAYKVKPDEFSVLASLGNVMFDLERYAEAERWYKEALKRQPDDVEVRTDLGLAYYLRQPPDLDRAIATFRESLSRNPKHEKTLQNLITALIDKGDAPAARGLLRELERINPANPALGQFRERLGTS